MKNISILAITAAILGAATGLPLNVTSLVAIGCAAGLVALFVHDYGRFRRRFHRRAHRASSVRPPPRRPTGPVSPEPAHALVHKAACSVSNS